MEPRALRRLQHHAAALLAPSGAAASSFAAPLPLPITADGVPAACLSELAERKMAAAAAEDYREAANLKQMIDVLTPRAAPPSLPPDASAEERTEFLRTYGYVMVECFAGEHLRRLQEAWRRAQAPVVAAWNAAKAEGEGIAGHGFANAEALREKYGITPHRLFVDIPVESFFAEALQPAGDPVLLDLVDPPQLVPVLEAYLGADVKLCGVQPRTYTTDPELDPEAEGYTL